MSAPEALQHDPSAARPLVCGPDQPDAPYPLYLEGKVQHGFGRGSKELNCPTANLPDEAMAESGSSLQTGVHFGFAQVEFAQGPHAQSDDQVPAQRHEDVFPMVMSVGWNPYYKNERRTAEVHVLHQYPRDFYGHHLKIAILGFIRPEYNYTSLEALIEDIETDKKAAFASLDRPAYQSFAKASFFS